MAFKCPSNHYDWLYANLATSFAAIGVVDSKTRVGMIVAHGDKCSGYKQLWESHGIHYYHGVVLYLLSYVHPWSKTVRETENGWVPPDQWVVEQYKLYGSLLPPINKE